MWKDGEVIDRTLKWPEVQKKVRSLPAGVRRVYVQYTFDSMAIDDFRLAYVRSGFRSASPVNVTHVWKENGTERRRSRKYPDWNYRDNRTSLEIPTGADVVNEALDNGMSR